MPNRREFIKTGTAATAGIFATHRLAFAGLAQAPATPDRATSSVAGRRAHTGSGRPFPRLFRPTGCGRRPRDTFC